MKIKILLSLLPLGITSLVVNAATDTLPIKLDKHNKKTNAYHKKQDKSLNKKKVFLEINGEKIPSKVIERRLKTFPGIPALLSGQFQRDPLLVLLANQILNENLLKEIAKSKNLYPSKEEISKKKAEMEKENPSIISLLKQKGFKDKELEEFLTIELIQYKILTHGITVTEKDVEEHYNKNNEQFTIPKKYELRLIAAKDDAAKKAIDAELGKKVPFSKVAESEHNSSPTKAKAGLIGEVPENVLSPELKSAISSKKVGEITDWVKMGPSNMKFLIEKITPESKKPLNAELKKQIKEQLMIERGQSKNNIEEMMRDQLKKSNIKYHDKFGKSEFEKLIEKSKEAPAVTMPSASISPTPSQPKTEAKKMMPAQPKVESKTVAPKNEPSKGHSPHAPKVR